MNISFEKQTDEELPDHVLKGIAEGQQDMIEGRFITLNEFKKRLLGSDGL